MAAARGERPASGSWLAPAAPRGGGEPAGFTPAPGAGPPIWRAPQRPQNTSVPLASVPHCVQNGISVKEYVPGHEFVHARPTILHNSDIANRIWHSVIACGP